MLNRNTRAIAAVLAASLLASFSAGAAAASDLSQVRIGTGVLQGVLDNGVVSFKGIPYAAPPVAEQALQTTSPSILDSEGEPQDGHRSSEAVQSAPAWQSGQTRTCSPPFTPRFQGLAPLTGSFWRAPQSRQGTAGPL